MSTSPRLGDPFALQRLLFDLLFRQSQPDVHSTLHPCNSDDPKLRFGVTSVFFLTFVPRTRVEVFAVALVIVSCVDTWECFTALGIMAASVGAQVGQVPQAALAETSERAQLLFSLMVLFQVTMLASAVWFVGRKRVAVNVWQCFRRPSNWLLGAGLMLI